MIRIQKRVGAAVLAAFMAAALLLLPAAASAQTASAAASEYISKTVTAPSIGSVGGEWAVLGLARGDFDVPEGYFEAYYARIEDFVSANGGELHDKKYTEYSRVVLALTAIGADPANVGGYNLLTPLGDFEKTIWQGVNSAIFALIALDSVGYEMPANMAANVQATRQMYVEHILSQQLTDGGWSIAGGSSDPDMTAMALQALSAYQSQGEVSAATDRALLWLSAAQDAAAGYSSWGKDNCESVAQVLVALCALEIGIEDSRFVKNGATLLDALLSYQLPNGSFSHAVGSGETNLMATEQALYALVALSRFENGRSALYVMDDVKLSIDSAAASEWGLPGKHDAVKKVSVINPGVTFSDISGADCEAAVEALASRGIITGMGDGIFAPEETMTRAQFTAIVTRALGIAPEGAMASADAYPLAGVGDYGLASDIFDDISRDAWYVHYVGIGSAYGLVQGVGEGRFNPEGTISRQEAAVLISRAAALCGMDTERGEASIRDVLAQFSDYRTAGEWATLALTFCYDTGILNQDDLEIEPLRPIIRGEIAQMIFNLLEAAKLL